MVSTDARAGLRSTFGPVSLAYEPELKVGFCCGQTERCGRVSVWAARSARTRFSLQTGGFTRASRVYAPHARDIDAWLKLGSRIAIRHRRPDGSVAGRRMPLPNRIIGIHTMSRMSSRVFETTGPARSARKQRVGQRRAPVRRCLPHLLASRAPGEAASLRGLRPKAPPSCTNLTRLVARISGDGANALVIRGLTRAS